MPPSVNSPKHSYIPPQKFDDLATTTVTSLTGVGNYDGVNYNAFSVLANGAIVGGVASQSLPNRTNSLIPAPLSVRLYGK